MELPGWTFSCARQDPILEHANVVINTVLSGCRTITPSKVECFTSQNDGGFRVYVLCSFGGLYISKYWKYPSATASLGGGAKIHKIGACMFGLYWSRFVCGTDAFHRRASPFVERRKDGIDGSIEEVEEAIKSCCKLPAMKRVLNGERMGLVYDVPVEDIIIRDIH
nr:hypothetical protein Iba_chr03dCG6170 [Ipomoea batatas]